MDQKSVVEMTAYYNEFDPFAASWLRELIKEGLIADGVVDERSITEVTHGDLKNFTQCHFFAGIGGWSLALKLAKWPDNRQVWTGSPPCQPFSIAGKQLGKNDNRHLWPAFFNLIRKCKPPTIFGEQVASAIKNEWFDDLQDDMERENYATAMVVLPACSVGAPQKRERLWFVSDSISEGSQRRVHRGSNTERDDINRHPRCSSAISTVGDTKHNGLFTETITGGNATTIRHCTKRKNSTIEPKRNGQRRLLSWKDSYLAVYADGKHRAIPFEPSLFPLADGIPNRVGLLRGAGNAIVPEVAEKIITAFMCYKDISFL